MVAQAVHRLAMSTRFLAWATTGLVLWYGYLWLPVAWVAVYPPFRSYSVEIRTENGLPVSVVERRDVTIAFAGSWRVRVIDLTRDKVRCYLPQMGPKLERYRPTSTGAFDASWEFYTGDDGRCLVAMRQHPGTYETETHRQAWVWWRWVDLPVARSILSFEVSAPPSLKGRTP